MPIVPEIADRDRMPAGVFVVIPAYNEERRLARVVAAVRRVCERVIVVDDGSRDRTATVAAAAGCEVIRHAINRGQGAALQTGIDYALREGASCIVTFDADGQHQVEDLPAMVGPILSGQYEVVLGNRFSSGASNVPPSRRVVLRLARAFTRMTSGLKVGDAHNGYRAFSRHGAAAIQLEQDRMAHASEIYDQIRRAGLSFVEVPVTVRYSGETLAKGQKLSNAFRVLFHYFLGKTSR